MSTSPSLHQGSPQQALFNSFARRPQRCLFQQYPREPRPMVLLSIACFQFHGLGGQLASTINYRHTSSGTRLHSQDANGLAITAPSVHPLWVGYPLAAWFACTRGCTTEREAGWTTGTRAPCRPLSSSLWEAVTTVDAPFYYIRFCVTVLVAAHSCMPP